MFVPPLQSVQRPGQTFARVTVSGERLYRASGYQPQRGSFTLLHTRLPASGFQHASSSAWSPDILEPMQFHSQKRAIAAPPPANVNTLWFVCSSAVGILGIPAMSLRWRLLAPPVSAGIAFDLVAHCNLETSRLSKTK
jgi:hypothetical protein